MTSIADKVAKRTGDDTGMLVAAALGLAVVLTIAAGVPRPAVGGTT